MKRILEATALLLLAGAFAAPRAATAVNLTLSTSNPTPNINQSFLVTVGIEGLGDMTDPSLRAFTLRLDWSDPLLDVDDVVFEGELGFPCELGDPNPACEAQVFSFVSPGSVLFAENSLLPTAALANQPGSFTLATIELVGLIAGPATLLLPDDLFTDLVLSDLGMPEGLSQIGFSNVSLDIEILPEPSAALLLGAGLALFGLRGRRAR